VCDDNHAFTADAVLAFTAASSDTAAATAAAVDAILTPSSARACALANLTSNATSSAPTGAHVRVSNGVAADTVTSSGSGHGKGSPTFSTHRGPNFSTTPVGTSKNVPRVGLLRVRTFSRPAQQINRVANARRNSRSRVAG
jgi:hypothetical protein